MSDEGTSYSEKNFDDSMATELTTWEVYLSKGDSNTSGAVDTGKAVY